MTKSIYIIKNTANDKVYVGQAINPHRRFVQHLCNGNRGLDSYPIHKAIEKYGKDKFFYEILEDSVENYNEREAYWIAYYNSLSPNGYNILPGGSTNPILRGEEHPRNTLTNEQVNNIIDLLVYSNFTQRKIADITSTTERIVNSINSGQVHRKNEMEYPLREKFCHFSKKMLKEIKWLLQHTNASYQAIADFYGISKGNVAQINNGKIHKEEIQYPLRNDMGKPITKEEIAKLLVLIGEEYDNQGNN